LKGEEGKTILTRDGSFVINEEGTLVHGASGRAVLGAEGQPIKLNPALEMKVNGNGEISQGEGNAVKLKLVEVADPRLLIKMGSNLLTVADEKAAEPAKATLIRQGSLEMSAVDPMVEMVNMMAGQRIFDANAKLISLQDSTLQSLNTIGRVA
jgi:flagellar basal body rod protein FlgG